MFQSQTVRQGTRIWCQHLGIWQGLKEFFRQPRDSLNQLPLLLFQPTIPCPFNMSGRTCWCRSHCSDSAPEKAIARNRIHWMNDVRSYARMPWPLWSLPHPQRCKWMSSKRSWATRKSNSSWSRVSYGRYNSLYILLHNAKLSSIFFHSNLRKLNESDWPPSTTPLVLSRRALRQSYKTRTGKLKHNKLCDFRNTHLKFKYVKLRYKPQTHQTWRSSAPRVVKRPTAGAATTITIAWRERLFRWVVSLFRCCDYTLSCFAVSIVLLARNTKTIHKKDKKEVARGLGECEWRSTWSTVVYLLFIFCKGSFRPSADFYFDSSLQTTKRLAVCKMAMDATGWIWPKPSDLRT